MNLIFPSCCGSCLAPLEVVKLLDAEKLIYAVRFRSGCGGPMSPVRSDDGMMVRDPRNYLQTDECRAAQKARMTKTKEKTDEKA